MLDLRTCETCIRRPRHVGGNGSCVLIHRRVLVEAGTGREQRETVEEAWPRHVTQQGVCSSWKPGDLRERPPAVEQEGLF